MYKNNKQQNSPSYEDILDKNGVCNKLNEKENKLYDISHFFKNFSMNIIEGKIFPEFINKGIADNISVLNNNTSSAWTVNDIDIFIKHVFWENPRQSITSRIPLQLLTGNTDGTKFDGILLHSLDKTDYLFCLNSINNRNDSDKTTADIMLVKIKDIIKYLETMADIPSDNFMETVYALSDNYNNVINEALYTSDDDTIYLCKGAYISFIRDKKTYLMCLNLSSSIARKLPNTRHFKWSKARGLVELSDKLYRPELNKNKDDDKPLNLEFA